MKCFLCPRACGVDREQTVGFCGEGNELRASRAAKHFWEEPVISGTNGSGAVFFSGCSLRCIYCQNRELAEGKCGKTLTPDRLADIFLRLMDEGAHNINLVTATHFTPQVALSIEKAKSRGLNIPVVWNSSAYECVETLKMLSGLVDIYLPDYKYSVPELSEKYSRAKDYPSVALAAISEMFSQVGTTVISDGLMKKGVIIRHLVLPGHIIESKQAIKKVFDAFGNDVYYSIMRQYTPLWDDLPPKLRRTLTDSEYRSVVDFATSLGIEHGFTQEKESAKESFVPMFDLTGV